MRKYLPTIYTFLGGMALIQIVILPYLRYSEVSSGTVALVNVILSIVVGIAAGLVLRREL